MKNLIDVWYDVIEEEAAKNNYTFRIDKETNPLLYKWSNIIRAAMSKRDNILLDKEERELYEKYLKE